MGIYGADSPYSSPQVVGYDNLGRPIYDRNARQKTLGVDGSLGGLPGFGGFGGPTTTTTESGGGGVNPFGMARQAVDAAKTGRDIYNYGSDLLGGAGALGPSSLAALAPATGPGGLAVGGGAASQGMEAAGALSMPEGFAPAGLGVIGPSTAMAAGSTATGPGGLLVGGGATSLAPEGAAAGAAGSAGAFSPLMYGAGGLAAMTALIALGGGFDGPVPSMGAGGQSFIGPDGKISGLNIGNRGTGTQATPQHYAEAQRMLDALNQTDLAPWANQSLMIDYGSDKDRGFDRPLYDARFEDYGRDKPYNIVASNYDNFLKSMQQVAALGPNGLAGLDPHALTALLGPELNQGQVDYFVKSLGQQDSA